MLEWERWLSCDAENRQISPEYPFIHARGGCASIDDNLLSSLEGTSGAEAGP